MLRLLAKIILILGCTAVLVNCSRQEETVLHDTDDHAVQLTQWRGKWVIVNYWAPWCESCVAEVPELNLFYQHNRDKNIVFYGVNYDHLPKGDLKQAMAKLQIAFPVLVDDPSQALRLEEITMLPTTFIIDPRGRVVKKIVGGSTEQVLLETINP